jgi:hypothetical protein
MMKRRWLIIIGVFAFLAAAVLVFWYFQSQPQEGVWVCRNGEWVKQGEPVGPAPTWECEEGEKYVAPEEETPFDQAKFERSKTLAQEAAENSPTYQYDGTDLKFESSEELTCANCWEFTFSFSSRHAGYGNRSGQFLAQVITPHQIRVNVEEEKIVAVVTDRTFDELKGIYLK